MGGKTADRLYVLDCGQGHTEDQSRWTVGVNVGKPIDISVSCYLIHDSQGYFLWDTGISDYVASMPNGWQAGTGPQSIHWTRSKTLLSQLAAINVKPSDIRYIGISHTHPDHIGNVELFAICQHAGPAEASDAVVHAADLQSCRFLPCTDLDSSRYRANETPETRA